MNENYYDDEIDLKDLILYILKKWRVILIGLLVGLLIGISVSLLKMNDGMPDKALKQLEEAGSSNININNIRTYANYKSLYEEMLTHEENSVLFNLDSNNVYTANLSYSFTSSAKDEELIKEYLLSILSRDNSLEKVHENSGKDYSLKSIEDLISITSADEMSVNPEGTSISISSNKGYGFGTINISIIGEDEDFVRDVKNTIEKIVNDNDELLKNKYADYTLTKVRDNVIFGYNADLADRKMLKIEDRQELYDSLVEIENKLNADEKLYYNYYFNYGNVFKNAKPHFSKKWPVIGGFITALLVCGYYFIEYLFNGKVKSEDEIRNRFNIPLLGVLKTDNKEYKGIDKILNDLEKCEYVDYIYIDNLIKSFNKKIMICNEEDSFSEELKKIDKKMKISGYLDKDDNALEALKEKDGIVLVSQNKCTDINRIERQVELAKKLNKEIFGFISTR